MHQFDRHSQSKIKEETSDDTEWNDLMYKKKLRSQSESEINQVEESRKLAQLNQCKQSFRFNSPWIDRWCVLRISFRFCFRWFQIFTAFTWNNPLLDYLSVKGSWILSGFQVWNVFYHMGDMPHALTFCHLLYRFVHKKDIMQASVLLELSVFLLILRLFLFCLKFTLFPLHSVLSLIWAWFIRLWFFHSIQIGLFHHKNIKLHCKYRPIVCIASDHYFLNNSFIIKIIYSINFKWVKSDWYEGWKHSDPNQWTLFLNCNIKQHVKIRRLFQGMYFLSSLVTYENYVNECTVILLTRMAEFAKMNETINMRHWLQCYTFNVIEEVTYSKRFSFLNVSEDIAEMLSALQKSMMYSTLIEVYTSWHSWVYSITKRMIDSGVTDRTFLMNFVQQQIFKRKTDLTERKTSSRSVIENRRTIQKNAEDKSLTNFLTKIMMTRETDLKKVSEYHVFMMGLSNIIAESNTTAVSLSAILYYLLKHSEALQKLRDEINDFEFFERLERDAVWFKEAQKMPYLQAVMKKALWLHSVSGLPLWRVMLKPEAEISDKFFLTDTIVDVNTWVAHANEDIFGSDAEAFRPERWIEAEKKGEDMLKWMNAYYFSVSIANPL